MTRSVLSAAAVLTALAVSACEHTKSSNPLAATVAGPIPGVAITAPKVVEPTPGAKVAVDLQPVTLTVENANTSGVRPLSYMFEVAIDATFTNKVFMREGVEPGDGRTKLRLPDPLATGRSYFWRVRAQDGANTGPFSDPATFNVFTPIVIEAPGPIVPSPNSTVTTLRPQFVVNNARRSGPVGAITYQIEVSDTQTFAAKIAAWSVGEQPNQTTFDLPVDLKYSSLYYWHVRGTDPTTIGPWSATLAFATPAPPPVPSPTPTPGPGGDFNLAAARIVVSPDVRSWPVTSEITSIRLGGGFFHIDHTKRCRWPGVDIGGALQESTVWVFFQIGGQWYGSGGERLRPCQTDKELGRPSDIGPGWFYSPVWAPMAGYVPQPGELVGFMMAAGSTRADSNAPVHERSRVVLIRWPGDGGGSFPPFFGRE
jgi:hypothetical protein